MTVYEKALDTNPLPDGSDLAVGTVTGSLPGSALETDASNTLTDNVTGGFGTNTYALVSSATGLYGTIQINSNGSYVYTLTKPFDTSPDANDGANTEAEPRQLHLPGDRQQREHQHRHDLRRHRRRHADGDV